MTEREKIAARIRALRAKTVENGCTEDEAVAAAAKVAELLARYNMTVEEADLRESPFDRVTEPQPDDLVGQRLWKVADAIAHLSGARYWASRPGEASSITFFGFSHEVEVSGYLLDICGRAMRDAEGRLNRQWALLVVTARRRKIIPFIDGMADRLAERIRRLKPLTPPGTGLVVLRDALIEAALKDEGLEITSRSMAASRSLDEEYLHGRIAADRVALNAGVAGGQTHKALT